MNTKLIVANWKMNPESIKEAKDIVLKLKKNANKFSNHRLVVCPPFIFLNEISSLISSSKKILLGAQDVFVGDGVSHTGEVGIEQIKKAGAEFVIIGHSERRNILDSEDIIKEKAVESLKSGLKVILCVGERNRNEHGDYYAEVKKQIEDVVAKTPKKLINNLIIAYEPIWAIGKSECDAMRPDELHEMSIFIKRLIGDLLGMKEINKIKILYGGSVTKNNAKDILDRGNVDGLLIGRESLKIDNFIELIRGI
jgi:triosephosphate isomerase